MAFVDWVFNKSDAEILTSTEIFTPIIPADSFGTGGSLRVDHFDGLGLFMNAYNNSYVGGILKGRIRSIIQPDVISGASTYLAGFTFMQNQLDLTGGSGSFYGAFYIANNGGTTTRFTIRKYSVGLESALGGSSLLLTGSLGTFAPGTPTVMEIEWDASSGTQVDFILRASTNDTNFDNLAVVSTVSDTVSPLVTSVGEGLATANDVSSDMSWLVDNTSIFTTL
jgi:hypothetical protein